MKQGVEYIDHRDSENMKDGEMHLIGMKIESGQMSLMNVEELMGVDKIGSVSVQFN